MNIFAIDKCPNKSAKYLCDKHLSKMAVESFQMLGSAVIRHGAIEENMPLTSKGTPLKGGYHYHPCTKWAGDTYENFVWLASHGISICKEYTDRYQKVHACQKGIYHLLNMAKMLPMGGLKDFAIAISDDMNCRKIGGFDALPSIIKYRLYYKMDKPFATWKQNKPRWFDYSVEKLIQSEI
jgi:hypothetical protein